MAEESDLEKTEDPSPRRLEQAREEGQVPQSRELSTFLVTVTGAAALLRMGNWMATRVAGLMRDGFAFDRAAAFEPALMLEVLQRIVAGQRPTEIALAMHLSIKTVSTHKARIQEKLRLSSMAALIRYGVEHDLGSHLPHGHPPDARHG